MTEKNIFFYKKMFTFFLSIDSRLKIFPGLIITEIKKGKIDRINYTA